MFKPAGPIWHGEGYPGLGGFGKVGGAFSGFGKTLGHLFPFPLPVFGGGFFLFGLLLGASSEIGELSELSEREAQRVMGERGLGNAAKITAALFRNHFGTEPHIVYLRDPEDVALDWVVFEAEREEVRAEEWLGFWEAVQYEVGVRTSGYFALSFLCGSGKDRNQNLSKVYFEALRETVSELSRILVTEPRPNRSLHFWAKTTLEALGQGVAAAILDDLRIARLVQDFLLLKNPNKRLACGEALVTMAERLPGLIRSLEGRR